MLGCIGTFHLRRRSFAYGHPRLRLRIVGTGFIGQQHLRNAVQSDEVDVIAIALARGTASAVQATRDFVVSSRTPRVRTVEELLADAEVEAVLVHTGSREDFPPSGGDAYSGRFILDVRRYGPWTVPQAAGSRAAPSRP